MQSQILQSIHRRLRNNKQIHRNEPGIRINSVAMIFRIRNQTRAYTKQSIEKILMDAHEYEVLFLQRSIYEGDPNSGQICFPGGKTENNECDVQTAIRQTREQTNLRITVDDCIGKMQQLYFVKITKGHQTRLTVHLFLLRQHQPININYEIMDYRWVPFIHILHLDQMHTQLHLSSQFIVRAFASIIAPEFSLKQSDIISSFRGVVMPAINLNMSYPLFGLTLSFILELLKIIIEECQVDETISQSVDQIMRMCSQYRMEFDPRLPNRQAISKRFLEQYSKIRLPKAKL